MTRMIGRAAILEIFRAEGVRYVFGNPGTTELGFLEMLQDDPELEYILCLHEGGAIGMAQMYANASGRTGVVNLHVAPGLGNALGMLYNAAVGKMPLVVTAGQQDTRMLVREPILSHDLVAMARPLTKWAVQLQHVEEIPVVLPRAFKVAQDPPRGPVFVSLPGNVIEEEADLALPGAGRLHRRTRPDPEGVTEAAKTLLGAEHPVIVCGDGVAASGATGELVAVAEALGAPVWNTPLMGALNFPLGHPCFRGELPAEHGAIRRVVENADVVFGVGADLFHEVFYGGASPFPEGCSLIHLDDSPWEIAKNLPTAIGLLGDPKLGLRELNDALRSAGDQQASRRGEERRAALAEQKEQERERQRRRAEQTWDRRPISPARLMAALRDVLPQDAVIYSEAITATPDLQRTLALDRPASFFGNQGGGIGQALPGALGVKLALPDRPVVAVVGDGSAMYSVQSLWTAAHHRIPVVYVVLSNRAYRILKYNTNRYRRGVGLDAGRPYPAMDLNDPPLDFVSLARGLGVDGRRVEDPAELEPTLAAALERGGPYVLEVATEGHVPIG